MQAGWLSLSGMEGPSPLAGIEWGPSVSLSGLLRPEKMMNCAWTGSDKIRKESQSSKGELEEPPVG